MKLKRTVDVKNVIGLLFKFLFIYMVINLINSKYNLALSAIVIFACIIYGSIFERCIYLENSYLYIKRRNVRQKPNSLKDNHIRLSDVHSYSLNNPFLQFSDFCLSEKNITLYLNISKSICFAAKEQDEIIKTLNDNNIFQQKSSKPKGLIKLIIFVLLSLIISVVYFVLMSKNKTESSIILFILTLIMTVYFLYKVIYGLVVFNYRKNK